jgi:diguanylate cyclase (GGDEF)-like protein
MSIGPRAIVTACTAPIVGAAIWASGGASSFLQPLLFFTVLFIAYFFPARLAWPLVALFAFVYATPLFYDPAAVDEVYPARTLGFVVAMVGEFKAINDEHGHPVGDAVLVAIANACDEVVRDGDCLARIGGDEFAVIAPRSGAAAVAHIVAALEVAIGAADLPPEVPAVRASFAWAVAPIDATTPTDLLDCADQRLLHRKWLNKTAF